MRGSRSWKLLGIAVGLCAMPALVLSTCHRMGAEPMVLAQLPAPGPVYGEPLLAAPSDEARPPDAEPDRSEPLIARRPLRNSTARTRDGSERFRSYRVPVPPVKDRTQRPEPSPAPSLADNPFPAGFPRRALVSLDSSGVGNAGAEPAQMLARTRRTPDPAPEVGASWPWPTALVRVLEELRNAPWAGDWAEQLLQALGRLHESGSLAAAGAGEVLAELERLARAGIEDVAGRVESEEDRGRVLRASFSLQRRLAIWHVVRRLSAPDVTLVSLRDRDQTAMLRSVAAVQRQLIELGNAAAWREYLLLDPLERLAAERRAIRADDRSQLAREILRRLELADATPQQRQFFSDPAWQVFGREVRQWISEPVHYGMLLQDLERLELASTEEAARRVADHYQAMRWSPIEGVAELGDLVNRYYRNANVRVAISEVLLNRLLPHPDMFEENVDDYLLGGRIFGRSRVSTRLRLVLFPDRQQWRMGLEAHGDVESRTETKRGPAVFHNAGRSRYLARKLLLIDRRGIRTQDAEAEATANNSLTKLRTDLDGVPLVNMMVRSIARQQYDSNAEAARWETEGLVARSAQTRLDEEVDQQLTQATDRFRQRVLEPLHQLGLDPEAIDMETTTDRLIARYRLAGPRQVGAFTPRPQAPVDSLFSLQIHESVLNNTTACLELHGRELDLHSLLEEIARKFHRADYRVPDDVPEDVTLQLAEYDPITFVCQDDRIELTLRVARLAAGDRHVWRDFEVRATYAAEIDGLHLRLVRDGYIRLRGRRLSLGDQVALRGIFSKTLAQQPDFDLLGNVLVRDARLHDLRLIQLVVRDGWIGLAVGTGNPVKIRVADTDDSRPRG